MKHLNLLRPRSRAAALAGGAALVLSACAGYSPSAVQPGQTAEDVARSMGPPTARYTRPDGGQRIEYARGPMGKHTFMIDLDASGRVTGWSQVLTEKNFNALPRDISSNEVLLTLGTPSDRRSIPRQRIDVWSYRYDAIFCQWFQVSVGRDGRVTETSYAPDPLCDKDDRGDDVQ